MDLTDGGGIDAIAMIVDINEYELLVERGTEDDLSQFTRDVLVGGVAAVEKNGGEVVAFMGDAFLAVLPTPKSCGLACFAIAKDLKEQCDYFADVRHGHPEIMPFLSDGVGIKIAIESGKMDVSAIGTRFMGQQRLLAGSCINYAARIAEAGTGNRCHLGPRVAAEWPYGPISERHEMTAKHAGKTYYYHVFDLSDIWED